METKLANELAVITGIKRLDISQQFINQTVNDVICAAKERANNGFYTLTHIELIPEVIQRTPDKELYSATSISDIICTKLADYGFTTYVKVSKRYNAITKLNDPVLRIIVNWIPKFD